MYYYVRYYNIRIYSWLIFYFNSFIYSRTFNFLKHTIFATNFVFFFYAPKNVLVIEECDGVKKSKCPTPPTPTKMFN